MRKLLRKLAGHLRRRAGHGLRRTWRRRDTLRRRGRRGLRRPARRRVNGCFGAQYPPQWPFEQPSLASLHASPKEVSAHWHWFPISFDKESATSDYYATQFLTLTGESGKHETYGGYLRERPVPRLACSEADWELLDAAWDVTLAKQIGIDGFFLNMWNSDSIWHRLTAIFDGATKVGGFGIVPNFDLSIMKGLDDQALSDFIVKVMSEVKDEPSLHRMPDGRVVIGTFYGHGRPPSFYQGIKDRLKSDLGIGVFVVPVFLGTGSAELFAEYASVSDLLAGWGTAIPEEPGDAQSVADKAKAAGKPWMHPVLAQDLRPHAQSFQEAQNSAALRTTWEGILASDQDWAQIVSWNDHAEHHSLRPSTGKQWGFYDLTAYYITWFKTGKRPPIVRDALYYFHRVHPSGAVPTHQSLVAECTANCPARDEIEVVALLTGPGTIEIEVGGKTAENPAPAGMSTFRVALAPGRPRFRLRRGDTVPIDFESAFEIRETVAVQDLLYRASGSLRAAMSASQDCEAVCEAADAPACLACPSEPMWRSASTFLSP